MTCSHDPRFKTPTYDRWTDGQTDRHMTTAYTALASRRAVKTENEKFTKNRDISSKIKIVLNVYGTAVNGYKV